MGDRGSISSGCGTSAPAPPSLGATPSTGAPSAGTARFRNPRKKRTFISVYEMDTSLREALAFDADLPQEGFRLYGDEPLP